MKYHKLTMVLGTIFGVALLPIAYISLVAGIALAFANMGEFSLMAYVFAALAIATIICSLLSKKSIWASRIALTISTLTLVATIIFLIAVGLKSAGLLAVYIFVAVLGILATVFSYLAKTEKKQETPAIE